MGRCRLDVTTPYLTHGRHMSMGGHVVDILTTHEQLLGLLTVGVHTICDVDCSRAITWLVKCVGNRLAC